MMETITKITAFVLALLSLMACSTDEPEPDPDGPDGPVPVVPYDFSAPIFPMEGFELGFEMWPTPTIDDSNLQGEYYIYLYWREHKGEAGNLEELLAMCNVPDDLLKNMSTPNLARTCFNHPYNAMWMASDNVYYGIFNVIKYFNGYEELMKRRSGIEASINLFSQLGYAWGQTTVSETELISWSLLLCSAADYMAFNNEQVARLAKDVLSKKKYAQLSQLMDLSHSYRGYCLLGAFIAYHYDETLPEEQRILLASFIKFRCMNFYGNDDALDRSLSIIDASLNRLAESANESNQQ